MKLVMIGLIIMPLKECFISLYQVLRIYAFTIIFFCYIFYEQSCSRGQIEDLKASSFFLKQPNSKIGCKHIHNEGFQVTLYFG